MAVLTAIALVIFSTTVVVAMPTALVSVTRPIFWYIDLIIPSVFDEIDGPATGVILITMLAPLFCVSRRNMQIDRRRYMHAHRHRTDHNRGGVNDLGSGIVSDIDLAIESRLTDADRDADIGGLC